MRPDAADWRGKLDEYLDGVLAEQTRPNGPAGEERQPIVARPFVWRDPATFARRDPILGKFWRGFLSATVGATAVGKTSRSIIDDLEITSGIGIFHPPRPPENVWSWNLEDPLEEMEKRFHAPMMHYGIRPEQIAGRLYLNGREDPLTIAIMRSGVPIIDEAAKAEIITLIGSRKIALLRLDPFISAHQVNEVDPIGMQAVCKTLIDIANITKAAIDILHHPTKAASSSPDEMTIDALRGSGAIGAAIRAARIVRRMTAEEAQLAGIDEINRILYFCTNANGKPSMRAGTSALEWCRLISVNLGNTGPNGEPGDSVQVATPWKMPGVLDTVSVQHLDALLAEMGDDLYPSTPNTNDWLGHVLGRVAGIDTRHDKGGKARVAEILKLYAKAGQIVPTTRPDTKHGRVQPCWQRANKETPT